MIHTNVKTEFSPEKVSPKIDTDSFIHPLAAVIGNVEIGKEVMVAPFASIRGDEGQPIHVGDFSNIQDGVIIHALETEKNGKPIDKNTVEVDSKKYAVYISYEVSLAHQSQVHGPALIKNNSFIGMKSLIFKSIIGENTVVEPGCIVMGVTVPDGRYIPAGTVLKQQEEADSLLKIDEAYSLKKMNQGVVEVNRSLAKNYSKEFKQ